MPATDESTGAIKHAVTCGGCSGETYMYERYCHLCGHDRWEGK